MSSLLMPTPPLTITNLVATFRLTPSSFTAQEYLSVARIVPNVEYNPAKFHAIFVRIRRTNPLTNHTSTCTALVYRSGRVVLTHAGQCVEEARAYAKRLCRRVDFALGRKRCTPSALQLRNVVGSARLPFKVHADRLLEVTTPNGFHLHYDPTIFPALRCKMSDATVLVFNNGKLIITGVDAVDKLNTCFVNFYNFIRLHCC
jgi:TATA-box binding protein (TBP) (component of TFIID and TFIIIB)